MKVTLDHNCIIDLQNSSSVGSDVRELLRLHGNNKICLRVVGIGASELKPNKTYSGNFSEFKDMLKTVGLGDVEVLKPIGHFDVTFFDWGILVDNGCPELVLEKRIHNILFPDTPYSYKDYCKANGMDLNNLDEFSGKKGQKWRNKLCDVLAIWCHIHSQVQ